MIDFKKDTWYWFSSRFDRDIFYPVFIDMLGRPIIDGKIYDLDCLDGLVFHEAVMPFANA